MIVIILLGVNITYIDRIHSNMRTNSQYFSIEQSNECIFHVISIVMESQHHKNRDKMNDPACGN